MIVKDDDKILSVSKPHKGRVHDFKIRKGERFLPRGSVKIADSGYQGWQKLQSNVFIPIKRSKKRPLGKEDRLYNRRLASFRMRV
jgi:hypothetical protein